MTRRSLFPLILAPAITLPAVALPDNGTIPMVKFHHHDYTIWQFSHDGVIFEFKYHQLESRVFNDAHVTGCQLIQEFARSITQKTSVQFGYPPHEGKTTPVLWDFEVQHSDDTVVFLFILRSTPYKIVRSVRLNISTDAAGNTVFEPRYPQLQGYNLHQNA